MIWTLVRKDLLSNLLTLRLGVAVVFTVVLSALTTLIGSLDYSRHVAAYQGEVRHLDEELGRATTYSAYFPVVLVPPQPLSILCRGVTGTVGQWVHMGYDYVPVAPSAISDSAQNELMKTLVQIDFATVVTVLLSFLALVLGFDGICGERERGTLQQVLSNPVPRGQVVLAKLIAGTLSLWIPLALALVISLLIVLGNPDVALTMDDWVRLGLLFVLACLFLAEIHALSLMVSSLVRDSDTSLILCLLAWLVSGIGYLNILPSVSRYAVDEPPWQVFADQRSGLWREYNHEVAAWEAQHPSPGEAYLKGIERDGHLRYAHPRGYAWLQQRHAYAVELELQTVDRIYAYHWGNYEPLAREAQLVDDWAFVSPLANYQVLSYRLARTTLDDWFLLTRAAREYRRTFLEYLRGRGAFGDRRWFTDDPPHQEPMIGDPAAVTGNMLAPDAPFLLARLAWAEEQEKRAASDPGRRLDLAGLPRFGGQWQRSLGGSLAAMVGGLAVLLGGLAASVLVTVASFLRYDPR